MAAHSRRDDPHPRPADCSTAGRASSRPPTVVGRRRPGGGGRRVTRVSFRVRSVRGSNDRLLARGLLALSAQARARQRRARIERRRR